MLIFSRHHSSRRIRLIIAALALTAMACTSIMGLFGASDGGGSPEATVGSSDPVRSQSQCGQEGFACSYAEASPQVLERSRQLLLEAGEVMEQGGTIEEAAELLEGERDVSDILYDRLALRFRVEAGPPMWLIHPAVMEGSAAETAAIGGLARPTGGDDGPVGNQDEGEDPEHQALILAPFFWDFNTNEGGKVAQILGQNKNYRCVECRDYIFTAADDIDTDGDGEVDDNPDFGVTLTDFQRWESYQIIHISTHGAQICRNELDYSPGSFSPLPADDCYTALFTGVSLSQEAFEQLEGTAGFATEGVIWAYHPDKPECHGSNGRNLRAEGCVEAGRVWQALTADFFRFGYPGGLEEKFIFLSSCESMKGSDLSTALAGGNTTVLGWTESVDAGVAASVVGTFYKFYIEQALDPEKAYTLTKEETSNEDLQARRKPKGGGSFSGAVPEIIRGGSPDPHGVEIITIMHPVFQQELLDEGSMLVQGIPGDGEPDELLFQAQLNGIDESKDVTGYVIRLNVDGQQVQERYQATNKISDYGYQSEVLEVPLGFDVSGREVVEIDAWVEIPQGGVSRHVVEEVKLASCGWTGTMSGSRSGELKGDLVINLADFANLDPELLEQLGFPGEMPTQPGSPAADTDTLALTGHPPYPALLVNELGLATAIFSGAGDAAIGVEQGSSFQFQTREPDYYDGTVNATMLDAFSQGNVSVTANFVWNAGSLCDIETIAAAAENAPEQGDSR